MTRKRNLFLSIYVLLNFILVSAYIYTLPLKKFDLAEDILIAARCFYPLLIEFCIVLLIVFFAWGRNRFLTIFCSVLLLLSFIMNGIQYTSSYVFSDFLTADSLGNFEHVGLVINAETVIIQVLFILAGLSLIFLLHSADVKKLDFKGRLHAVKWAACMYLIPVAIAVSIVPFIGLKKVPNFPLYQNNRSPAQAFASTIYEFGFKQQKARQDISSQILDLYSPHISPKNKYPLVKDWIYRDTLPFADIRSGDSMNVIVFFVESFSARNTSVYNPLLAGLTPNIKAFSDSALVIDNYYNHTAATYRGIQGQLCSMFPYHCGKDGWQDPANTTHLCKTKVQSVVNLLKPFGYRTVFIGSEDEKTGGLDDMAKDLLLFDEVYCQNSIMSMTGERKLNGYSKTLSDHQLMRGLVKYLSESDHKKKLFMSVYNLGTHAWFDTHKDSLKYKDGKISIYNVVHDFDHAFGQFWTYFKKSSYYKNTIVVITADHCYPPESDFVKLAGDDYSPYFVDRVPLIIYDPFHRLPHTYPGNTRTSIDFAPTLLHLMEIPNTANHFLGASLFESRPHSPNQFSAVGDRPYLITKQGIFTRPDDYELVSKYVDAKNYIDYLQTLELSNRVWGEDTYKE